MNPSVVTQQSLEMKISIVLLCPDLLASLVPSDFGENESCGVPYAGIALDSCPGEVPESRNIRYDFGAPRAPEKMYLIVVDLGRRVSGLLI